MTSFEETVEAIRSRHRKRRYAMKLQQKIDRALESYVRRTTDWHPDLDEKEREKYNALVKKMITAARKGEGDVELVAIVQATDKSREPADRIRDENEKTMAQLAQTLPVFPWVESIRGAGALGLATIVAEAGALDNYANPQKLWNRLGFAPYDGLAGSTWKRESWRTRTLSKEEWIEHPFSGQRYALIHQIAVWLVNSQWIAAGKTETGEGKPNGVYGEVYADRRAHTALTHPDWSKQHARMDGLRVAMKAFLCDLWNVWNAKPPKDRNRSDQSILDAQALDVGPGASGQGSRDAHSSSAARASSSRDRSDHDSVDAQSLHVGPGASGQSNRDAHAAVAARVTSSKPSRKKGRTRDDYTPAQSRNVGD